MNTRVILLAVATGLFIATWKAADQHSPTASQTARSVSPLRYLLAGRQQNPAAHRRGSHAHDAETPLWAQVTAAGSAREQLPLISLRLFTDLPVPLPHDIQPGVYRVVSDDGYVSTLMIGARDVVADATSTSENALYQREVAGVRWFFIRLNGTAAEQTPRSSGLVTEGRSSDDADGRGDAAPASETGNEAPAQSAGRYRTNRKFDFTGYLGVDAPSGRRLSRLPVTLTADEAASDETLAAESNLTGLPVSSLLSLIQQQLEDLKTLEGWPENLHDWRALLPEVPDITSLADRMLRTSNPVR